MVDPALKKTKWIFNKQLVVTLKKNNRSESDKGF